MKIWKHRLKPFWQYLSRPNTHVGHAYVYLFLFFFISNTCSIIVVVFTAVQPVASNALFTVFNDEEMDVGQTSNKENDENRFNLIFFFFFFKWIFFFFPPEFIE